MNSRCEDSTHFKTILAQIPQRNSGRSECSDANAVLESEHTKILIEVIRSLNIAAITDKTVMVVIAHLFGSRMDMNPVYKALVDRPDILIIEDCAQAYGGINEYTMQSKTDLSMFSFGSIKSITALGCAVGFTSNYELYSTIKKRFSEYDRVNYKQFRSKVFKYFLLKILSD